MDRTPKPLVIFRSARMSRTVTYDASQSLPRFAREAKPGRETRYVLSWQRWESERTKRS